MPISRPPTLIAFALAVTLSAVLACSAQAAVYDVNTTADPAGPGCTGGVCSLRQAATQVSNGAGSGDTVTLPAGNYELALGVVDFDKPVTVVGAGARSAIVDANGTGAVLSFGVGASPSTVSGITVTGGSSGGINSDGTLTINNTTVAGNQSLLSTGGGVYNNNGGVLAINNSTISGNSAYTVGGGIYNKETLVLTNSTVSGNTADIIDSNWDGGGIYSDSALTVINSTVAGNTAARGGGVSVGAGTANFRNTIVAGNTATGVGPANCLGGAFISDGGNLEDTSSCSFNLGSDQTNTLAGIGPLADNGGPTDTRALLAGSAAIDRGTAVLCPASDQRGVTRPQIGTCDVGAYEHAPPTVTTGSTSARNTAGATIAGSVNPNLRATSYHFDYGVTTAYGSSTAVQSGGAGNAAAAVSAALTGLRPNRTYHYRLVASNADGSSVGADGQFTTASFAGAKLSGSRNLVLRRSGRVGLRLSCPAVTAGGICRSVAALYTSRGKLPSSLSKRRKAKRLGKAKFSVAAGKVQAKSIKLNRAGRRAVKRGRKLRARLLITSRDSAGNAKTRRYRVKIKRR